MSDNPYPVGSPEWQAWLNNQIAEHDDDPDIVARDTKQEIERHKKVRGDVEKDT